MRRRLRSARGFSLVEVAVVSLIALAVLLAAQQMLVSLLREGKALGADSLTAESLPFLLDRMHRDISAASGVEASGDGVSAPLRVRLTYADPAAPAVVYDVAAKKVTRTEKPPHGPAAATRSWSVKGELTLLPAELAWGRLSFLYRPPGGDEEFLAFALPSGTP